MNASPATATEMYDCRKAWASTLEALAAEDERIVAVVNDSVGSSNLGAFRDRFPDRTVNVGIAEQNMVGVGAGLANGGRIPFVSGAACFLTARALEQLKADIAYAGFNVKLVGQSAGIAYGELGATHHSIEDYSWLRALKQITVIVPADPFETEEAVRWAAHHEGPVFIRLSRMPVPMLDAIDADFVPGKARRIRTGNSATIIANGTTVHIAAEAADHLRLRGLLVRVLDMHTLTPLDEAAVLAAAEETGAIVTVEEALVTGGLGGAVAELTSANRPVPVERVGFPGFLPTGSVSYLFEQNGLSRDGIAAAVVRAINRKKG